MIRTLLRVTVASAAIAIGCLFYVAASVPHWNPAHELGRRFAHGDFVFPDEPSDQGSAARPGDAHRDLAWSGGDSLTLEVPGDVTVVPGGSPAITAAGTAAVVDRLELADGVLRLRDGESGHFGSMHLTVTVTAPALVHLTLRSAAQLEMPQLRQDALDLHVEGAVHVHAAGRLRRLTLTAEGASHADLSQLMLTEATIGVAGASAVRAGPTDAADITVRGVGVVTLTRHPRRLTKSVEGVGAVIETGPDPKADDDTSL